jgi:hypothetical protein
MRRSADGFFLPVKAQSTRSGDAGLFGINARQIHREKIDFVYLDSREKKSLNHSNLVTAITDGDILTLVMCGYSASSIFEFAPGSSSGEIQVDSRPNLNRANFPGRSPELKKIADMPRAAAKNRVPSPQEFSESIQCSKHSVLIHSSTI